MEKTQTWRNMMINISCKTYESDILHEKYNEYCFPNGFKVYILKKKMATAYALLGTKYGSLDNTFAEYGKSVAATVPEGVAHFLEHKLFSNSDGSDSFERFSSYGAEANAYTSFNRTAYLFSCTENFALSLSELLDFVTHPYFTEENVKKEMGIIAEEIRMYEDNPGDRCFYGMLEGMYEHHSIKQNICGSIRSISNITPDILYQCYNAFYTPSNMVLVICGDVEDDAVINIVSDKLKHFSRGRTATRKENENLKEKAVVYKPYVEQKMQVSKPLFAIGFKDTDIPSNGTERQKKDAEMAILNEMLFSRAGSLYNSLLDKNLISPNFFYGYTISESSAYNSFSGESDDPKKVLEEICKHIDNVRKTGLSKKDFEIGKRVMYAEFVKSFDSTDSIANNLFSFVCEDAELLSYADIINSITFEDIEKVFEKSFCENAVTLSVISPI